MPVPGASANPANAALPVSPEVAVTIMIFSSASPSAGVVRAMNRGRICSATSLNAEVGPWNSSRTQSSPNGFNGVIAPSPHCGPYAASTHSRSSASEKSGSSAPSTVTAMS